MERKFLSSFSSVSDDVRSFQDDPDEQSLLANESRREQMMAEQEMLDTEVEFLRERDEQIRNLEVPQCACHRNSSNSTKMDQLKLKFSN